MTEGQPGLQDTFRGTPHVMWTPLTPDQVAERLQSNETLLGHVHTEGFSLRVRTRRRNSWRPRIEGKVRAAAGGSLIEVSLQMHPFVAVFTLVHGLILLGIAWIMAFFAYQSGITEARNLLSSALDVTHFDAAAHAKASEHVVATPEDPGAAAAPPLSFATQSKMHETRFVVKSSGGAKTTLVVKQASLTLERGGQTLVLDWNDIQSIAETDFSPDDPARGQELVLETVEGPRYVPIGGHPSADRDWLARFLSSRNARWSEAEADRLRGDADRQRLAAMKRSQQPT